MTCETFFKCEIMKGRSTPLKGKWVKKKQTRYSKIKDKRDAGRDHFKREEKLVEKLYGTMKHNKRNCSTIREEKE